eukprot:tig00020563_g11365.t1
MTAQTDRPRPPPLAGLQWSFLEFAPGEAGGLSSTLLLELGALEAAAVACDSSSDSSARPIPTSYSDDELAPAARRLATATQELLEFEAGAGAGCPRARQRVRRRTGSEPRLRPRPSALPPLPLPMSPSEAVGAPSFFGDGDEASSPSSRRQVVSSLGALFLSGLARVRSSDSIAAPSPPTVPRSAASSPAYAASAPGAGAGPLLRSALARAHPASDSLGATAPPAPALSIAVAPPDSPAAGCPSPAAPSSQTPPLALELAAAAAGPPVSPRPLRPAPPASHPSPVPSPDPEPSPTSTSLQALGSISSTSPGRDRASSLTAALQASLAAADTDAALQPLKLGEPAGPRSSPSPSLSMAGRRTSAPAVPARPQAMHPPCICGFAVLLADDEPVNRLIGSRLFSRAALGENSLTDAVPDGRAAVEAFCRAARSGRPYDVIILDLDMPRLGGLAAAEEIRAAEEAQGWGRTRMVAWSAALGSCAVRARAVSVGFDEALAKPVPNAILLSRVLAGLPHRPACPCLAQPSPHRLHGSNGHNGNGNGAGNNGHNASSAPDRHAQ